jgi:hypothetical protein
VNAGSSDVVEALPGRFVDRTARCGRGERIRHHGDVGRGELLLVGVADDGAFDDEVRQRDGERKLRDEPGRRGVWAGKHRSPDGKTITTNMFLGFVSDFEGVAFE